MWCIQRSLHISKLSFLRLCWLQYIPYFFKDVSVSFTLRIVITLQFFCNPLNGHFISGWKYWAAGASGGFRPGIYRPIDGSTNQFTLISETNIESGHRLNEEVGLRWRIRLIPSASKIKRTIKNWIQGAVYTQNLANLFQLVTTWRLFL